MIFASKVGFFNLYQIQNVPVMQWLFRHAEVFKLFFQRTIFRTQKDKIEKRSDFEQQRQRGVRAF